MARNTLWVLLVVAVACNDPDLLNHDPQPQSGDDDDSTGDAGDDDDLGHAGAEPGADQDGLPPGTGDASDDDPVDLPGDGDENPGDDPSDGDDPGTEPTDDDDPFDIPGDDEDDSSPGTEFGDPTDLSPIETEWYIFDDGIPYETTSNGDYFVDFHGDPDLYWYEPSGARGLMGSADPAADFQRMRSYVRDRAGASVDVDGPLTFASDSDLATFEYATYTYILCDFWFDEGEDPTRYGIRSGPVDDGIQVMVNGIVLGGLRLGEAGASWPLTNVVPGARNTVIIILVDDSRVDKFAWDLAFTRDGEMVQ